eukprot:SAG31_NODE_1043_length_10184_cov_2.174517_5_plen_58_part_00
MVRFLLWLPDTRGNHGALLTATAEYDMADATSPRAQHDLKWRTLGHWLPHSYHSWKP